MRVLMVSDVYFPRVNGVSTSIQTFRRDLADARLRDLARGAAVSAARGNDDARVRRQPSRYLAFDPEDRMMKPRATLAACRDLAGRVDVLHMQTPFVAHGSGLKAARQLRVPTLETYHTFFEEYLHHYVPLLPRGLARARSRARVRAGNATPSTPSSRRRSNSPTCCVGYGVSAPIRTIPTGLASARVRGRRRRARSVRAHGIAPIGPSCCSSAASRTRRTSASCCACSQRCAGARAERTVRHRRRGARARRAAAHRGGRRARANNTLLVGYLDRRGALLDCYRAADVFVFASRTETQGLVLLESLALGVPVVSTAVLGTKEVLGTPRAPSSSTRTSRNSRPPSCACSRSRNCAPSSRAPAASSSRSIGRAARWRGGCWRFTSRCAKDRRVEGARAPGAPIR